MQISLKDNLVCTIGGTSSKLYGVNLVYIDVLPDEILLTANSTVRMIGCTARSLDYLPINRHNNGDARHNSDE